MKIADIAMLPVFPYAEEFPFVSDEDCLSLAQDIEINGLINPIVTWEGQLLDGRNRLRALLKTNLVEADVIRFTGTEYQAAEYVNSCNLQRRHMDIGQRAMIALAFLPYEEEENNRKLAEQAELKERDESGRFKPGEPKSAQVERAPQARDIVAEKFNVTGTAVSMAKKLSQSPVAQDLVAAVSAGEMKLNKANDILKDRITDTDVKRDFIKKFPEAWELYSNGTLDLYNAYKTAHVLESAAKAAREVKVSKTVLLVEGLADSVERQVEEINLSIGLHINTESEIKLVLEHIGDIFAYLAVTKNALELRRIELEKESK